MKKITSQDCIEMINKMSTLYGYSDKPASKFKWKRISKHKVNDLVIRVFRNEEWDYVKIVEAGNIIRPERVTAKDVPICFVVKEAESDLDSNEKVIRVTATPLEYFKLEGACDDIGYAADMMPKQYDAISEGLFEIAGKMLEEVRVELLAFGLVEDPGFTEFINGCDW